MKTLAQYVEMAEDELGRQVLSKDNARNLVHRYVQQSLDLIYTVHPWLWLLQPEGTVGEDIPIVVDQHLATLPTGLLDIRSIRLIDPGQARWRLIPRHIDWIDARYPDPTFHGPGYPHYYARIGTTQIKFVPRSSGSFTLRLRFTMRPAPLMGEVLSPIPANMDWLVAESACALGFNRLRMYEERDARFSTFTAALKSDIEEDRNELQQEYAIQPYSGPGSVAVGLPAPQIGEYWNTPDIRFVE